MTALVETISPLLRHCEERSDEAIQKKGCAEFPQGVGAAAPGVFQVYGK